MVEPVIAYAVARFKDPIPQMGVQLRISAGTEKSGPCLEGFELLEHPLGHTGGRSIVEGQI